MGIASIRLDKFQRELCQLITDDLGESVSASVQTFVSSLGNQAAFEMAHVNQLASIVAHAYMTEVGREKVPFHWRQAHEETHSCISSYLCEMDRVADQLAEEHIPLVALKNAGIARGIYPCPGCCPMGDLDVLVEKRHFRHAHQILIDDGYHFEFRSPLEEAELEAAERSGGAEYWKVLSNGEKLWFELQWRPVAGRWIRSDQEPSAEELMARSIAIPGTEVRLLSPEDNLLQVALHTAKHSYVRAPGFRLHTDVDRIARRQSIDWDIFLQRVLALQVKTAVYFSLAIPHLLFQTPIPDEVLARLKPSVWKEQLISRWLQRLGLFNPDEKKFSKLGFIFFTALLYDDAYGLYQGAFPDKIWMQKRYRFDNSLLLPYYHVRRLFDLAFRRMST